MPPGNHRGQLTESERKKERKKAKQTLDLEVANNLEGRLVVASSKPSPPPLTEVAQLKESGVVGLAWAEESEPFFLLVINTCLEEERRCLTLQSTLKARTAPSLTKSGGKWRRRRGAGSGSGWFSFKSSSTTKLSSVIATWTHSSSTVILLRR